tara:strand:- start:2028 stop:2471 length:444 start_codon:yes stop_codon:yes gene_type:complete
VKNSTAWEILAEREAAALGKLSQRKRSLSIEKARLEKRINDIDEYILEYTSGLKEETELEHSLQKINSKMNMVTQLASGRKELEKIHKECELALELVTSGIMRHQEELLKFNKVRENKKIQLDLKEKMIENKELDELALNGFISGQR